MPAEDVFYQANWLNQQYFPEIQQATANARNPKDRAVKVWQVILLHKPNLMACIVEATWWRKQDVAEHLGQLYIHVTEHIHRHYQFSMTQVRSS